MSDLFKRAKNGDVSILDDPSVDKVKDNNGWTPLHYLAWSGRVEVLNHPSVDIVKDNNGWTPLYWLARSGRVEVLNHPSVDIVKDNNGWTPLHWLAGSKKLTFEMLKQKYPWYEKKNEEETIEESVTNIVNTPNSIRFILE